MLDNVIDLNFYPTLEAENSNLKHRPVGAGSMGWHDVFHAYGLDYSSDEAVKLSDELYEFISFHCILNSSKIAGEKGPYSTYKGSLWSEDILPVDTYKNLMAYMGQKPILHRGRKYTPELDWKEVRSSISTNGMRNSNTMAIAPTATISYIQGCSPSIDPDFSTFFVYENKSGNLFITNEWFVKECKELGIWNNKFREALKMVDGDVNLLSDEVVPSELKCKYKTAFDQDQFKLVDCAAARQKWIDMGQSLNLFNNSTSLKYLNDLYFHAKDRGLKSTYYLRNKSASKIEKSTSTQTEQEPKACSILDPDCESCQ
jgi:ribonucleoside-diphosphate reductase alpha chain